MDELYSLLSNTGLPVSYRFFKNTPTLPYIIYLLSSSENFGADDKVYCKAGNYQVELYSEKKDKASEKKLEDIFDSNDIYWDKTETYIKSEGLYQVLYEITM